MENKWQEIWSRRRADEHSNLTLADLIALDGFDGGAGKVEVEDWREYVRRVAKKLALKDGNSVYEVGCGGGAFLYALTEQNNIKVGGNDYSTGLIEVAQGTFPGSDIHCVEAAEIDTQNKYDYVISNSVFHYFDLDYAKKVLLKMLDKARFGVCILEIPDLKTKDQSEELRRDMLTSEEYEKKYAGLNHTYYDREWFVSIAKEHELDIEIFDGCVPNYAQNQFRFGVFIRLNKFK